MSWAVEVRSDGEPVVTIEDRMLSGRDISEADADLIRECAAQLLAFVGFGQLGWQAIPPMEEDVFVRNGDGEYVASRFGDEWLTEVDGETIRVDPEPTHWRTLKSLESPFDSEGLVELALPIEAAQMPASARQLPTEEQVQDFAKTIRELFTTLRDAPVWGKLDRDVYEAWVEDMQGRAADMLERMPQK